MPPRGYGTIPVKGEKRNKLTRLNTKASWNVLYPLRLYIRHLLVNLRIVHSRRLELYCMVSLPPNLLAVQRIPLFEKNVQILYAVEMIRNARIL
jgi:hypothetical protein